jgi:hypothetical protein
VKDPSAVGNGRRAVPSTDKARYPVRGRVLRGEQPLAGIKVGLPVRGVEPGQEVNLLHQLPFIGAQNADYFATTDPQGRFTLYDIPAGQYGLILIADLKSLRSRTVLVEAAGPVIVKDRPVQLPPIRFAPAITPLSPERQTAPEGGALTLRWEPRPRAARYEVFVAPDHVWDERSPNRWQREGQGYPSPAGIPEKCWHRTVRPSGVRKPLLPPGPQVQAPLAELRKDLPPQPEWGGKKPPEAYYWLVCAFDAQNRLLSTSEVYERGQWPKVVVQAAEGREGEGRGKRGKRGGRE